MVSACFDALSGQSDCLLSSERIVIPLSLVRGVHVRAAMTGVVMSVHSPRRKAQRRSDQSFSSTMEALADYFKVFSEPNRLAVLDALRQGPLNVTAVVEHTGLSQALVSKHLKLLTIAGVVKRRPEGSLVFYDVIDRSVFKLLAQAEKQLLAARRQQLDALAAIL
jgi:DNA-binding transcriptional ArsR family regulator